MVALGIRCVSPVCTRRKMDGRAGDLMGLDSALAISGYFPAIFCMGYCDVELEDVMYDCTNEVQG